MKRSIFARIFGLAMVMALIAAACGGDADSTDEASETGGPSATEGAEAGDGDGEEFTIITISGSLTDPFFSAWAKGTEQAGEDLGVNSEYTAPATSDNFEADALRLIEAAIERADAIITGVFNPESVVPLLEQAADKGIPVIIVNSGEEYYVENDGFIAFVGQSEVLTGLRSGQAMIDAGVTFGLCMNHVPQLPATIQRCSGFEQAFDEAGLESALFNLPTTDANNPQAIAQALQGQIASTPDLDGIYTLGSGVAESAMQAIEDQGHTDTITLATTDLSTNVLNAVKDGRILFASDQQPYLQGYMPVLIATQYLRYGLLPSEPIRTGPNLVTAENVDVVLAGQEAGVRGAS